MNNDTIKIQKIKAYIILMNDLEELGYKYNRFANNDEISQTTHDILVEKITTLKREIINDIISIVNE